MANVKITDLVAYTDPVSTDVLAIVDVGADTTKKVSIADLLQNASSGTAAAPGIAFDGDNTGIYSPGTDQIALATNGAGRLFIDPNGQVGIGTTSPSSNLHVKSSTGDGVLTLQATEDALNSGRATISKLDVDDSLRIRSSEGTGRRSITFSTSTTDERMRIDSDGRLLVGTSSSTAGPDYLGTSREQSFQIATQSNVTGLSISAFKSNNTGVPNLVMQQAGGDFASPAIVLNNRVLGVVQFNGHDGSNFIRAANIKCEVDGTPAGPTPGPVSMPGKLVFSTTADGASSPTERMTIKNDGKVGIGTESPSSLLHVDGGSLFVLDNVGNNITLSTYVDNGNDSTFIFQKARGGSGGPSAIESTDDLGKIEWNGYDGSTYNVASSITSKATSASGDFDANLSYSSTQHLFFTTADSPTERMTIKDTGHVYIGQTTTSSPGGGNTTAGHSFRSSGTAYHSSSEATALVINRSTSDGAVQSLRREGLEVGSISVTTTSTAYNTSSDYRLKENVVPLTGAADRVKQLKPSQFNFIADPDKTVDGFLAHEAQAVVPESVTGAKDEVDEEGNPVYQGIDQSKLVPLLTAALQEALTKIETLEQRLSDAGIA